jgi:dinuclear metal center YbgI/SA1388 family protein
MTLSAIHLAQQLHAYLPCSIKDYCPNGLQIEGTRPLRKIISGVTATLELLNAAQQVEADALLVHHGLFWNGDSPCLVGHRRKLIETFLASGISLYAYHLPLDIHPELGNNAQLAKQLDIQVHELKMEQGLLWFGRFAHPMQTPELRQQLEQRLHHSPLIIDTGRSIQTLAWCTGGGQRYFEQVVAQSYYPVDAYITGEISEQYVHLARLSSVTFIAAGHHATERYGVQALGNYIQEQFQIQHQFIECTSPV